MARPATEGAVIVRGQQVVTVGDRPDRPAPAAVAVRGCFHDVNNGPGR